MIHKVKKVALIGTGMIGSGIAVNCMLAGVSCVLQTRKNTERVLSEVKRILDFFEENQVITHERRQQAEERYMITTSIRDAVEGADLIQEAGPENLEIKRELYRQIEAYASASAYMTSTSSRHTCAELQEGLAHPGRFVCAHPWNPSYLLPLVELMGGPQTEPETIAGVKAFFDFIGKETVVCHKDVSGYAVNRISWAVMDLAKRLVAEGVCSAEELDRALMYGPGLRLAVTGQMLTIDLGTEGGLRNYAKKYDREPDANTELIAESIDKELAARTPEEGRDWQSASEYRDRMLLKFLTARGKAVL